MCHIYTELNSSGRLNNDNCLLAPALGSSRIVDETACLLPFVSFLSSTCLGQIKQSFFILSETILHVYSQLCLLCLGTIPIYENSLAASLHPGLCCIPRHEKLHLHHCSVRADGRHSWDYSFHFPLKFLESDLPIFLTANSSNAPHTLCNY